LKVGLIEINMTANYPKHKPDLFWLVVGLIVLTCLLTSCVTEKACSKYWTDSRVDSVYVHDTTIVRDTIIKIDERTLTVHDTVPCNDFNIEKDSNGVKILLKVINKRLTLTATCKELEIRLRLYDKVRSIFKSEKLTRIVKLKGEKTKFQIFKDYWFWITISILATLIAMKVLKTYAKFKLPF
jgi:hypothetical protein